MNKVRIVGNSVGGWGPSLILANANSTENVSWYILGVILDILTFAEHIGLSFNILANCYPQDTATPAELNLMHHIDGALVFSE